MKKLIAIIFILSLFGCASRKVQKQKEDTTIKQELTEQTKTDTKQETAKEEVTVSDTDELEIAPISDDKPLVVIDNAGKKTTVYNGKISRKKAKVNHQVKEQSRTEVAKVENKKQKAEVRQQTKIKNTERKSGFNWLWLLLLLIIPAYIVYRNFKNRVTIP